MFCFVFPFFRPVMGIIIAGSGLIERLGTQEGKGMKLPKGNGINGLWDGLAGLCRSLLAGFRPGLIFA